MAQALLFLLILASFISVNQDNSEKEQRKDKYVIKEVPELTTYILWVNLNDEAIDIKSLRRALAHSLDKKYIIQNFLYEGDAYGADIYGISSPWFIEGGYDIKKIKPLLYNLDTARYYFKKSGIEQTAIKLVLKSKSSGERSISPLEELQKQWMINLNANIDIHIYPKEEVIRQAATGVEGVYLIPIVSRNPTPMGFLEHFHSKSITLKSSESFYLEKGVYKNSGYDKYYEAGLTAEGREQRFENFLKAEQILIDEARVIPLYYSGYYMMHPDYVKNYPSKPCPYGELKEVYFSK